MIKHTTSNTIKFFEDLSLDVNTEDLMDVCSNPATAETMYLMCTNHLDQNMSTYNWTEKVKKTRHGTVVFMQTSSF